MLPAYRKKQKAQDAVLGSSILRTKDLNRLASSHLPLRLRLPLEPTAGCQVALLGPITSPLHISRPLLRIQLKNVYQSSLIDIRKFTRHCQHVRPR